MPKPSTKDRVVTGAQWQARLDRAALRSLEIERRVRQNDPSEFGVVDPLQAAACVHVLVVHHFGKVAHRRAGHRGRQHEPRDVILGARLGPAFDQVVNGGEIGNARRAGDEARIVLEVGAADDVQDRAEMMVAPCR